MKILYLAFIRLPTEKAHGLQIMKTCEALANAGAEVELMIPGRATAIMTDPFTYYGIRLNAFSVTTRRVLDLIQFGPLGFILSAISFSEAAHLTRSFWTSDIIYSRDAILLLQYVLLGRHLVYEAHTKPSAISRFVARRAYRVVVISRGLADAYEQAGIVSSKIVVAPDGIDLDAFAHPESRDASRTRLGLPLQEKIVLYIGRLDGWKGTETLYKAAELLPEGVKVVVIGGEEKKVADLSKKHPLVTFLGYRPYTELANNQAAADVLVLPNTAQNTDSVLYTSPLKLFTYMAADRPIVASDLPSLREVLDDSSAFFCTPDDAHALATTLKVVLADPPEAQRRAHNAKEIVTRYSWKERAVIIIKSFSPLA